VHVQFGEDRAQLTGIAMISSAFGLLATLGEHFPNDRVNDVVTYVGSVLGPERLCLGQDMDLRMERADSNSTGEEIIQMYSLKTSTMIEAALVPLMMLTGRPVGEIQHIKEYAHHAGIVFQIRDDLLDTTATSENLGKDTGSDGSKVNVVRAYGADEAQRCMQQHLEAAIAACQAMPYNTYLLQGIVTHFAERTH
jgi:geranylgeranyl pyrophosphate synthase